MQSVDQLHTENVTIVLPCNYVTINHECIKAIAFVCYSHCEF